MNWKHPDLVEGQVYGRLTIIRKAPEKGTTKYMCKCDCGKITYQLKHQLRVGLIKSCGCLSARKTHGVTGSKEYYTWAQMKGRCYNKNNNVYKEYGGRGIQVCERWKNSFIEFYNDIGKAPSILYTLGRIDNNGNYEPGNCKWETMYEQCNNRRSSVWIEYKGQTKTLKEWTDHLGLNYKKVYSDCCETNRYTFEEAINNKKNIKAA